MAKDVAALANATGGMIVVGVHTARPSGRDEEIATEVAAFPTSMFDPKQARDVVSAQVYPRIEIDVRTFDRVDEKRLAVIVVRQQDDDRLPRRDHLRRSAAARRPGSPPRRPTP